MNEEWDGKVRFTPDYVPMNPDPYNFMCIVAPIGNSEMIATSSDAGWSSFQKHHPNVCPKCKIADGLDENKKCRYCDYDNSPKECTKCGGEYRGEDYTKPLCQTCYDKKQAKKLKAQQKRWAEQERIQQEQYERERIAWRASVEEKDGEIVVDLDPNFYWDTVEPKKLTHEQALDLWEKLGRMLGYE